MLYSGEDKQGHKWLGFKVMKIFNIIQIIEFDSINVILAYV